MFLSAGFDTMKSVRVVFGFESGAVRAGSVRPSEFVVLVSIKFEMGGALIGKW